MDPKQVRAPWDWAPKILDPCEILQNIYEFNEIWTVKRNTLYKDDAVVYSFCGQLVWPKTDLKGQVFITRTPYR